MIRKIIAGVILTTSLAVVACTGNPTPTPDIDNSPAYVGRNAANMIVMDYLRKDNARLQGEKFVDGMIIYDMDLEINQLKHYKRELELLQRSHENLVKLLFEYHGRDYR